VEIDPPHDPAEVRLNVDGLEIRSVRRGGKEVPFQVEAGAQELRIGPDPARGPIVIEFSGTAPTEQLIGLYRSRIPDGYVLTSQCEPIGARKIFPCLDRPDRKARFHLTVLAPAALEVIANMGVTSVTEEGTRRRWVFGPTPAMSSYLFYLGVGKFDHIEDQSGRVLLRVFTPPGRAASGRFALETARRVLAACEEYYGIPYPLQKLDLVAVSELAFGAMENWGAIVFRDMRLLLDADSGSFERRDVLETIAHEIAHMWFGNLVTMAWWTDVWLNESFAAFLETKISNQVDPSLDPQTDFFLRMSGMGWALDGDSLDATHPVRARVERPEEISQVFDEISYGKGSSILAMLEGYLGEETFRRGIVRYLNRYCYANARTDDLWEALEQAAGEPMRSLVEPWIDRPGLPVVHARLVATGLELTQRGYSYRGAHDAPPWPIPMMVDLQGHRQKLRFDTAREILPAPADGSVHLNPGATGFYRTFYEPPLLDRLLDELPHRPATDRWIVLEDLFAFFISGEIDWPTLRTAYERLRGSTDRLVVESINNALGLMAIAFPDLPAVQDAARAFLADQIDRLGLERRPGEPATAGILRERISFMRVRVDSAFARQLAEQFVAWDRLDPDLRSAVAVARVRTDGDTGYHEVRRALSERARAEAETLRLERALAWTPDPTLQRETLDLTLSGMINRGHVNAVLLQAAQNPRARAVTWSWLQNELPRLTDFFRGSGFLSLFLEYSNPYLGLGRAGEVREFYRTHPFPEGDRGLAKGLERLELLERMRPRLPTD
jgi:tricorn protease interacting factor F2/3